MTVRRQKRRSSKYNAKRTLYDGIWFASSHEAKRYRELKLLERGKVIENLVLQPEFEILKTHKDINGKTVRGIKYVADFRYSQDGETIIEDAKGVKTDVYKLKKKLVEYIHQIKIEEV